MDKTNFYHFSNMMWTHAQFLRALMMRASLFLEQDHHFDFFIAILTQNTKK